MVDSEPFPNLTQQQLRDPDSIKDAELYSAIRVRRQGPARVRQHHRRANLLNHVAEIALRPVAGDGSARGAQGRALHTAGNDPARRQNDRNPSGAAGVVSSLRPTSGALMLGFAFSLGPIADPPPVVVPPASLADLDGTNGFRLDGIDAYDYSGRSVASAGDVNGDGFGDLIIGAPLADPEERESSGESYVVFGGPSAFDASFDLGSLDGTNGFSLEGIAGRSAPYDLGDYSGSSVASAGDVNGDGFGDLIVGAPFADPSGNVFAGQSYVVFGKAGGFTASFDLSALDGTNGFRLDGIDSSDQNGTSVASAGDVNGDGFADIIIGAPYAGDAYAGQSYVVFGKASDFTASLDLATLDGTNGFSLEGMAGLDRSGYSVASAGDVNGDGFGDIIIGAPRAGGRYVRHGESYVVFGRASEFEASLDLATLNGTNGFRLDGIDPFDYSGTSVASAGDVNGDGFSDIIIGAFFADPRGDEYAGESYVVFGRASAFDASFDLAALDGTNGFRLDGVDTDDFSGFSVAGAGDVNGDGFSDIIIGARRADQGGAYDAGESYVVFGRASGFSANIDLAALDGTNGFHLDGIDTFDESGFSVDGAGDIDGDGFDDLIIGAPQAYGGGDIRAGESYVVFGGNFTGAVTQLGDLRRNKLAGTPGNDVILGAQADDILLGKGGIDVLNGGESDDKLVVLDPAFLEGFGTGDGRILGGTGSNTLCLDGDGVILDLGAIPDTRIQGIETIDLGGDGNSLALDLLEIRNLDDLSNRLTVLGDKTNAVSGSLPGAIEGKTKIKGVRFVTFTLGSTELLVQADVDTSGIDTSGIDTSEIDTERPDRSHPIASGCHRRA